MSRRNSLGDEQKTRHQRVGPQPEDAVPGDETVRVPLDFINGKEFKGIDFRIDSEIVPGCGRHLIKPSVLGAGLILKVRALGYFLVPKNLRM